MRGYKRLTDKEHEYKRCASCSYKSCQYCGDIYDIEKQAHTRLTELEDKIENGTLIELPCRVGTYIYYIVGSYKRVGLFKKDYFYDIIEVPFDLAMLGNYKLGWFLTKDEAEARLKELQEE